MQSRTVRVLPPWASTALVVVVGIGVSGVLWALIQQNQELKAALAAGGTRSAPPSLAAGDVVPDITVLSSRDSEVSLKPFLDEQIGVLAVLTPTCPYCEQSLPAWEQLATDLKVENIPFAGILLGSAEEAEAYRRRHSITWTLWSAQGPEASRLGVARVPTTAVFSKGGVVAEAWTGALDSTESEAIAVKTRELVSQ